LDKKLKKSCLKYISSLDTLLSFIVIHFFVYPDSQPDNHDKWQSALYPEDLHGSSKNKRFQHAKQREAELYSMLDDVMSKYKQYRELARVKLLV